MDELDQLQEDIRKLNKELEEKNILLFNMENKNELDFLKTCVGKCFRSYNNEYQFGDGYYKIISINVGDSWFNTDVVTEHIRLIKDLEVDKHDPNRKLNEISFYPDTMNFENAYNYLTKDAVEVNLEDFERIKKFILDTVA